MIYVDIAVHREKGVAAIKNDEKLLENHVYKSTAEGIFQLVAKFKPYGEIVKAAIELSGPKPMLYNEITLL